MKLKPRFFYGLVTTVLLLVAFYFLGWLVLCIISLRPLPSSFSGVILTTLLGLVVGVVVTGTFGIPLWGSRFFGWLTNKEGVNVRLREWTYLLSLQTLAVVDSLVLIHEGLDEKKWWLIALAIFASLVVNCFIVVAFTIYVHRNRSMNRDEWKIMSVVSDIALFSALALTSAFFLLVRDKQAALGLLLVVSVALFSHQTVSLTLSEENQSQEKLFSNN